MTCYLTFTLQCLFGVEVLEMRENAVWQKFTSGTIAICREKLTSSKFHPDLYNQHIWAWVRKYQSNNLTRSQSIVWTVKGFNFVPDDRQSR